MNIKYIEIKSFPNYLLKKKKKQRSWKYFIMGEREREVNSKVGLLLS